MRRHFVPLHFQIASGARIFFRTLDSACMGEVAFILTHFQVQPIPVENTAGTRLREVDDIDNEMAGLGVMCLRSGKKCLKNMTECEWIICHCKGLQNGHLQMLLSLNE